MAEQIAVIRFTGGHVEVGDERAVPLTHQLEIANADLSVPGALRQRRGHTAVGLATDDPAQTPMVASEVTAIWYLGTELRAVWRQTLWRYDRPSERWYAVGPFTRLDLAQRWIATREQSRAFDADVAPVGDRLVSAWSAGTASFRVVDPGGSVIASEDLAGINCRVTGLSAAAVVGQIVSGQLQLAVWSSASPATPLAFVPFGNCASFDTVATPDDVCLIATTDGAGTMRLIEIDDQGGVVRLQAFARVADRVAVAAPRTASEGPVVAYAAANAWVSTVDVQGEFFTAAWASDGGAFTAHSATGTPTLGRWTVTRDPSSAAAVFAVDVVHTASTDGLRAYTAPAGGPATLVQSLNDVRLAGHGIAGDGIDVLVPLSHDGAPVTAAGACWLLWSAMTGEIVGRTWDLGRAGITAGQRPGRLQGDWSTGVYLGVGAAEGDVQGLGYARWRRPANNTRPAAIREAVIVPGGGFPRYDDGDAALTELGYHHLPVIDSITSPGGGALTAGTYSVIATYRWVDRAGRVHRSGVSPAASHMASTNDQLVVNVRTLRVTAKTGVAIEVWVTEPAGARYFFAGEADNDPTMDTIAISVLAVSTAAELLYTDGGVLSNDPTQSTTWVSVADDRLWTLLPDRDNVVVHTQVEREGFGPEFSPALLRDVPDARAIASVETFDRGVFLLGAERAYVTGTGGPPATGLPLYPRPVAMPGDAGVTAHELVARVPTGIVVVTPRGPTLIGATQDAATLAGPLPRRWRWERDAPAQLLYHDSSDRLVMVGMAGADLVYDIDTQRYGVERRISATMGAMATSGEIALVDASWIWESGAAVSLDGAVAVPLVVRTSWVSLGGVERRLRDHSVTVWGRRLAGHDIEIAVALNYQSGAYNRTVIRGTPQSGVATWGSGETWGDGAAWGEGGADWYRAPLDLGSEVYAVSFQVRVLPGAEVGPVAEVHAVSVRLEPVAGKPIGGDVVWSG